MRGKTWLHQSFILFFVLIPTHVTAQNVVSERIYFLKEDGLNYIRYETIRSNYSGRTIWFRKASFPTLEDAMKNILYFYPNEYTWDDKSQNEFNLLRLKQGSYAYLAVGKFKPGEEITVNAEGEFVFTNWDGKTKTPDGHYGHWHTPMAFKQFTYVWVFPENIEVLDYKCNRKGQWVKRRNTIAYYGTDVNDLVFTIRYRLRNQKIFNSIKNTIEKKESINVTHAREGIKITLGATVLFPSGESDLSPHGKSVLTRLAKTLKNYDRFRIIVSGHTDNQPITGKLAQRYPTNWELSAARALTVVHFLHRQGISEKRLEARAFGATQPVASNETEEGRAKNRRIEILITELP